MPRSTIKWAPKVEPNKIRRLYASMASGLLDETLLDDVFIGLYLRCQSIVEVTEASAGRVKCQHCGYIIMRTEMSVGINRVSEIIRCSECGWEISWELFYRSYKQKQLFARNALPAISAFIEGYGGANTARDRLMLIDRLIHAFHNELLDRPNRPVAINVIAGRWPDVVTLILDLAYGDDPSMEAIRQYWRDKLRYTTLPLELTDERQDGE